MAEIKWMQMTLKTAKPDNIVKLNNEHFFEIVTIRPKNNEITCEGHRIKYEEAFTYPCNSSFVGVVKVVSISQKLQKFDLKNVIQKCVKLEIHSKVYLSTILH